MKPECREHREKIAQHLLGDLTAGESRSLETHLAACPGCRSELDRYAEVLHRLPAAGDEPVPRHFFVYPEERTLNPWRLFRMMRPAWQAATALVAGLFLLGGLAGIAGFARGGVDAAALREDILRAAAEQNRRDGEALLVQLRAEIARSGSDLTERQKAELAAALRLLDSRMAGRLQQTEGRAREDAQRMAVDVYRTVTQQRARDLDLINLRFDGIETKYALETRQTDAILGTLLQVAELKLR